MESRDYWEKKEAHYILWCAQQMVKAKSRAEVYRIMTIWTNHVDSSHDWYIKDLIPKELR